MTTLKQTFSTVSLLLLFLSSIGVSAQSTPTKEIENKTPKLASGPYLEFNSGFAIANFLPLEGSSVSEHLVENGRHVSVGVGYGWELPALRIDAGIKIQYLTLNISGAYSPKITNDAYKATYGYLFPTISVAGVTKFHSKANALLGFSLGTSTFISDKQGQKITTSQIPVFGTFDAGAEISLSDWLTLRPIISWIPPFENLNVLTPQLGIRVKLHD